MTPRARALVLLAAVGVLLAASPLSGVAARAAGAPDPCADARRTDGWCAEQGIGYVANVGIRSRLLYDALDAHGHVLDLSTFTCPTCRKAIDTQGFCEAHRTGFVRKPGDPQPMAYFSRLTYEMARGERVDPDRLDCPDCRKNASATGWCAKHRTGMIGNVAIRDRAAWERADAAVQILWKAVAMLSKCEWCAIAMVTDTKCPIDKTVWHGGQPVR